MNTKAQNFDDSPPQARARGKLLPYAIVLAIIVMFLGMLIPSLARSREMARRASCSCNMKAIGWAMRLYAGDHGGSFPTDPTETTMESLGLMRNNYQTSLRGWMCPSDTGYPSGCSTVPYPPEPNPFVTKQFSYAYGAFGMTEEVQPDTPLAYDATTGDIRSTQPYRGNTRSHKQEGGYVLYADGHVEFIKLFPVPMYNGKNP